MYDEAKKRFIISLEELVFHNHCILTVTHLVLPSTERKTRCLYLLSAATDGRMAVWAPSLHSVSQSGFELRPGCFHDDYEEQQLREMEESVQQQQEPVAVCQAHQSGINDLSIQQGTYIQSTHFPQMIPRNVKVFQ